MIEFLLLTYHSHSPILLHTVINWYTLLLYALNTIRVIKLRTWWVRHVASMAKMRNVWKMMAGKHEGKRSHGRPQHRWGDNIKMYIKEIWEPRKLSQYSDSAMDWMTRAWFLAGKRKEFFSMPLHPDWLWGPPNLLTNGNWGFFPQS